MFVLIVLIVFIIACGFGASLKTRASAFIGALGPTAALAAAPVVYGVIRRGETLTLENLMPFPFEYCRFEFGVEDAVFMIPLLIVGFTVALFGICLKKPEHAVMQPHFWFFLNITYAGMMILLIAGSVTLYIIGWEIMSWAGFFLICTYYKRKEVRDAGIIYFVTGHLMFLLILIAVFMFDYKATVYPSIIFLAVLAGFGSRAGLVPFHVWLPEAQPAAPGHVSALLAGVMCNMGIYLVWHFTGIEMKQVGIAPAWWGYCLLGAGAASALYGAIMALSQHDLRRLLAYSVIETTGVIFMGIGLGYLAEHYGYGDLKALLFLGCALHIINHAVCKSLLFMSAGVIINQTEVSDMNLLGGVWKRLPVAGIGLVLGCAAAAGLPPLNGFIGEFLLFNGCVAGLQAEHGGIQIASIVMLSVLGLSSGLMIVCFTKLAGMTVMGEARCKAVENCVQSNTALQYPLLILMVLSVASGVAMPFFITVPEALWKLSLCMALLIALAAGLLGLRRLLPGAKRDIAGRAWEGGCQPESGRLQYSGSSYVQPMTSFLKLLLRFRWNYRQSEKIFPEKTELSTGEDDVILEYVYRPFFRLLYGGCMKMRWFQGGLLSRYILYIVLILLFLLVWKL
jgi:formate hydrogenlyase subunit 3/multisubunit Na+/H+ antiporter MnhD subunit